MTFFRMLSMTFRPESVDAGTAIVDKALTDTRGFDGCQSVDVVVDAEDPTMIHLVEWWSSPEAHALYEKFRHDSGPIPGLLEALSSEPTALQGFLH